MNEIEFERQQDVAALSQQNLFNVDEAALYLRCDVATLKNLLRGNLIPRFKLGGSLRFRRKDLDKFVEERVKDREETNIPFCLNQSGNKFKIVNKA